MRFNFEALWRCDGIAAAPQCYRSILHHRNILAPQHHRMIKLYIGTPSDQMGPEVPVRGIKEQVKSDVLEEGTIEEVTERHRITVEEKE